MKTQILSVILSVKNLTKTYGNGVKALRDVSFDVEQGEFLVVIGLSGSGKSTLMRCINRLQEPTSGEIYFQGQDIGKIDKKEQIRDLRRKMGMIFQHFNLIPRQSVLTNVLMGCLGRKNTWRNSWLSLLGIFSEEDRKEALKNLKLVGISEKSHLRADQLSGGQKQRVAIARALTQNPVLLLADEPVASLDPATCHVVMDYLKKVNQELGITVIANLHFLSLVRQYATRVIALKEGQIVFSGKPSEITEEWFQKIYGEGAQDVSTDGL
ncbi:phosphonate ABC transporter ATP-binding protein [Bdellovibrio svalbardensis]|uniref:Phosphonate ABC transporter ATP-binding protein n=1 Tax=Bdellovibrio svalbardensis TaxID=2972972 RepID=A0ABT6DFK1_9BACT|nr:phosphonate ABC transporter ATP-binding protein [Bdellovibrio svalbardensis]MDG0815621.1 phosphonate ABC transporter ATP-binding protein [Bdellovibrio svalbardensis]